MFKLFILIFNLWAVTVSLPPKGFDFEDKTLHKELLKLRGTDQAEWKEFIVPESLLSTYAIPGKFLVLDELNGQKKYIYVGRVNSCRQGGCSNPAQALSIETPEYFDYLVVFDANLLVQQVKVYNYQATHGQEVTNKGWLKQFQGYDGRRTLTVGKSIDAISGATVSVFGITNDIQEKTQLLKKLVEGKN
ncbi:MAG: FMN-binding protein [Bacteroidota bacterium]|nr:FMN-binding protein [Odoribacter sp.]MDP3644311.1 FMN-binding protein [Bacteroidota bacterium]